MTTMSKVITTTDSFNTLQPLIDNISMSINDARRKVAYGTFTLTELSHQLMVRFGRGLSRPNLVNMRNFYLAYPNCQTVTDNLTWSHIRELIKIYDNLESGFYEKEMNPRMKAILCD